MVGTFTPAMAKIFKHNQSDCMEVTTMHGLKPSGIGRVVHITQACNGLYVKDSGGEGNNDVKQW